MEAWLWRVLRSLPRPAQRLAERQRLLPRPASVRSARGLCGAAAGTTPSAPRRAACFPAPSVAAGAES
eukprot:184140-Rhodomonas_salina.1